MEGKGWTGLRLAIAIKKRDRQNLSTISLLITNYYPEKDIRAIWRPVKTLLSQDDIYWLETTLTELGQLRG